MFSLPTPPWLMLVFAAMSTNLASCYSDQSEDKIVKKKSGDLLAKCDNIIHNLEKVKSKITN